MSDKILIVDDEPDIRTFLRAVLKKYGYEVVTAKNGTEGIEVARRERPALIILDIMMPEQSGPVLYQQLRADETLADTPVIVVSGMDGGAGMVDDAVANFDKPISPTDLIAAVDSALKAGSD